MVINIWDIVVGVLLAAVVLAAVWKICRDRKKGKSCGCGCEGCSFPCKK